MIKKIAAFILSLFLLSPMVAFCGGQEKAALWAYFDALSKGDAKQLDVLLSPDFEYHFYKNNKLNKLNRDNELKSLKRLFKDLPTNSFNLPDLFAQDEDDWNKFHIKLPIIFEDSPKVYTDSLFRGAVLDIDETLIVTLDKEGHKIYRIVEMKETRRKNKLSFGFLKSIHLENTEGNNIERQNELIYELRDKNSHELLLIKKILDVRHEYIEETYYWPNNQKIENF